MTAPTQLKCELLTWKGCLEQNSRWRPELNLEKEKLIDRIEPKSQLSFKLDWEKLSIDLKKIKKYHN